MDFLISISNQEKFLEILALLPRLEITILENHLRYLN